jgi:hypothetical protein
MKTTESLSQDSRCPGRDLNPVPPEYGAQFSDSEYSKQFSMKKHFLKIFYWGSSMNETTINQY